MLDRSLTCALALQRLSFPTRGRTSSALSGPSLRPLHQAPFPTATRATTTATFLAKKEPSKDSSKSQELEFLRDELDHVESLEEIVDELEQFAVLEEDDDDFDDEMMWSKEALSDIFGDLSGDDDGADDDNEEEEDEQEFDDFDNEGVLDEEYEDDSGVGEETFQESYMQVRSANDFRQMEERIRLSAADDLERALLQGVVPVSAGVGNEVLPGDYGFDPLHLAEKDYFRQAQGFLLNLLPGSGVTEDPTDATSKIERPKALILRDLREAEVRHGRLAMLAAIFWPLQEMLDRLLLDPEQVSPIIYGPVTLPYFPLLMTAIMLLLGYLDIYAQAIKEEEAIGEAFLPGDCFWDPLRILQGAPDSMKRNMQEREILNGRVAMLAFALFTWEEAITHLPLIDIGRNDLLLEPAYEVPYIQQWLDAQFSSTDPDVAFVTPSDISTPQTLKALLDEAADAAVNQN